MINYKKGLLSIAAIVAMASGANAASDYLPLATDTNDYRWVMFGVDGFAGNSQTADFSAGGGWTTLTETTGDEVATAGFSSGGNMAELKALTGISAADELTGLVANTDLTGETFSETESMRTMFLKIPSSAGEANVMLTYKSSLEGNTVEFQINGSTTTTYTADISALNTYDSPAGATVKTVGGDSNASLTALSDIVDYDFSNNPQDSSSYLQSTDQDTANDEVTRMYSYDAVNSAWKIYDSTNTAAANDFSTLDKGMAYWGRMDMDGDDATANTDNVAAGLVLGSGGITDSDYADNNITAGWNLMSFSSLTPDIITATTGMILTDATSLAAGDDLVTIYDSTGVNSFDVTLVGAGTEASHAQQINMALEQAKARGDMPDTFDLRAFGSGNNVAAASTHLVLISNKKFYVNDTTGNAFTTATSLDTTDAASRSLWDVATSAYVDYNALSLPATLVGSVYGDFMISFRPEVGGTSAASLDSVVQAAIADGAGAYRSAAIQINEDSTNLVYLAANDTAAALDQVTTNLTTVLQLQADAAGTAASASGSAISFDIDNSGADDCVIAVSDTEFYIRDHTFIRVFDYGNAGAATMYVDGSLSSTASPGVAATAATLTAQVTAINTAADNTGAATETGVYAFEDGTNLIAVSASANTNTFNIHDSASDQLTDDVSTHSVADGAVTDVFLVNTLAGRPIYSHDITLTFANQAAIDDFDATTVQISVNGGALEADIGAIVAVTTDTERGAALDAVVGDIVRAAAVAGYDVNAYHDFNVSSASYPATITVESYSITDVDIDDGSGGVGVDINGIDGNSLVFGELITQTGDYTADLRYNAVSTPNYAQAGPVYSIKDNNYTIKALITGSTNMAAGTVAWDSIDLTRTAQEMFDSQDFNLFSIDPKAGYWAYLEANTDTNDLNITAVSGTLTPRYTHHFDAGEVTAQNKMRSSLTVTVSGLTVPPTGVASTERVWASVGGTTVELVGTPSAGQYTADIDAYSIDMNSEDVTVSVSDGEGWLLATQAVGSLDTTKPNTPVVSLVGGFSVDSNSTDVVGYYIFQNDILETDMHASDPSATGSGNYIGYVLDGAASIDFCSSGSIVFGSPIALLTVAVDGNGTFTRGNISDVASATYNAIEKGSNHYSHLGLGAVADELGVPYSSTCTPGTEETVDRGVSLKSVSTGVVAKLAIAPVTGAEFSLDIPNTLYVTDGTNIAEIKFTDAYLGADFYVQFDGQAYSGTLPANITGGGAGTNVTDFDTAGTAALVTTAGAELSGSTISGQSF